jgi:hypothetical protein
MELIFLTEMELIFLTEMELIFLTEMELIFLTGYVKRMEKRKYENDND